MIIKIINKEDKRWSNKKNFSLGSMCHGRTENKFIVFD